MPNSTFKNLFSMLSTSIIFLSGCGNSLESREVEPANKLPVIKVDQDHSQMRKSMEVSTKALLYDLPAPVNGFVLDTSSFEFTDKAPSKSAQKAIQVVIGKSNIIRIPVQDGKTSYTVETKSEIKSGQMLVIGIGYEEKPEKSDMRFYPSWAGVVKVK